MEEKIKVMISEDDVDARIKELGDQISKDYAGKQVHLVCILDVYKRQVPERGGK